VLDQVSQALSSPVVSTYITASLAAAFQQHQRKGHHSAPLNRSPTLPSEGASQEMFIPFA